MKPDDESFSEFVRVLKRRARPAAMASFAVLLTMTCIVFWLPAVYESSATLLIEQPNVSPELLLGGTGTREYVEQRLQRIRQRVLTADNVKALIERRKLYEVDGEMPDMEGKLAAFNDSLIITPQVTGVLDPKSMRTAEMTYAFDVTFRHDDPNVAQSVANELAELFISSNASQAEEDAERAISFAQSEADRLALNLRERESRLADFQQAHGGGLPDDRVRNQQRVMDLERDLARVDDDLRAARARKELLEAQLRDTPRDSPVLDETGQVVIRGVDRLAAAQQELVAALAKYSEDHPDVRRLRREIASLSAEVSSGSGGEPTNPVFTQLQTQVNAGDVAVRELTTRRDGISNTLAGLRGAIYQSPAYEKQYTELVRDYEMIKAQYQQMRERQATAELTRKAASSTAAETYVLINPARVPEDPVEPDRVALMFLAIVLAIAAGFGTVFLLNATDSTIRGSSDVAALLGAPPFGQIPTMWNPMELRRRRVGDMALVAGMLAVAIFIVLYAVI
jgi:polysaccharide chain length determinant protein (PEP-CTERM system associated)